MGAERRFWWLLRGVIGEDAGRGSVFFCVWGIVRMAPLGEGDGSATFGLCFLKDFDSMRLQMH